MASCHIYSCRARWRRFRADVITSEHKKAFYPNYNWQSDTRAHVFASCVNRCCKKRRSVVYSRRLGGYFSWLNVQVRSGSLTATAAAISQQQQQRAAVHCSSHHDRGQAGAQAQITGRGRACWLPLAITSICKCSCHVCALSLVLAFVSSRLALVSWSLCLLGDKSRVGQRVLSLMFLYINTTVPNDVTE